MIAHRRPPTTISRRWRRRCQKVEDLAGSEEIIQVRLAEALQYRPKLELM